MKLKSNWLIIFGCFLIIFSLTVLLSIFFPIVKVEINYQINKPQIQAQIKPVDENFGLVIPKIGANTKVIANVDPYDEKIYQQALTRGVAHARDSVLPNAASGNTFLFSHSSASFLESVRYNSIFYLIGKLEIGDEVDVYYQKKKYQYKVIEKRVVDPSEVAYLTSLAPQKYLTLMTCTPPGTTLKRLLVIAQAVD